MLFRGVTRAKMLFFNNNPSGRILNRFARDIYNVDSLLPESMFEVFDVSITWLLASLSMWSINFIDKYLIRFISQCFGFFVAILVIDVIVNPWLIIPSTIMTILFYVLRMLYIKTGRGIERIAALSMFCLLTHFFSVIGRIKIEKKILFTQVVVRYIPI